MIVAAEPSAPELSVGTFLPSFADTGLPTRRALVADLEAAGIGHLAVGDHVSFLGGLGFDGLIHAAHLLALSDQLPVHVGVYLLALRHPLPVARQLVDLAALAPGRLVLGVGVGGEDRHEYEICGTDPATRGARTDEALPLLRRLLAGDAVSADGPHYPVQDARILPAAPDLPILIGGRSAAALSRASAHGDGWLGIWVSAERYAAATATVAEQADTAGRRVPFWRHGLQVWCGFGATREAGVRPLAAAMQAMYNLPFTSFQRWCPTGTAQDIAAFLAPYVSAGARSINLIPRSDDPEVSAAGVADVCALLRSSTFRPDATPPAPQGAISTTERDNT